MKDIKVKGSGFVKLVPRKGAEDGVLFAIEGGRDVPFDIKRVYFITNLSKEKAARGKHAHKTLEQYIFCLKGSFTLGLDDGETRQEIALADPGIGVRLGAKLWHSMSGFSEDCVILVLADKQYDADDYLHDYDEFLAHVRKSETV